MLSNNSINLIALKDKRSSSFRKTGKFNYGFTLLEIMIAVTILSLGLAVIIGLESSAVLSSYNDKQYHLANLAARSLMSAIETEGKFDDKTEEQNLLEMINNYKAMDENIGEDLKKTYSEMTAQLKIEEIEIDALPGIAPPAANAGAPVAAPPPQKFKRIVLRISWGTGEDQHIDIFLMVP